MQARCRRGAGKVQGRCRRDAGEVQARCRRGAGERRGRGETHQSRFQEEVPVGSCSWCTTLEDFLKRKPSMQSGGCEVQTRCRRDAGEVQARCRRGAGKVQGRCRGGAGEVQARCRRGAGEVHTCTSVSDHALPLSNY